MGIKTILNRQLPKQNKNFNNYFNNFWYRTLKKYGKLLSSPLPPKHLPEKCITDT